MSKTTNNPLQILVNAEAIKQAEAQYRLARLFTPYGYEPQRVDFDRVAEFIGDTARAFPQPTEAMASALARVDADLNSATAILAAFEAQGTTPTLDAEQLFMTAKANVVRPMNSAA